MGSSTHYKNGMPSNNFDRHLGGSTDVQYNRNYFNAGSYHPSYSPPSNYQNWAMNQGLGYGALDSYYGGLLSPNPVADVSTYPGDEVGTPIPGQDIYGVLGPPAPAIRNKAVKGGFKIGQKLNSMFGGLLGGQGIGEGIGPNDNYTKAFGNPGHGDTGNQGGTFRGPMSEQTQTPKPGSPGAGNIPNPNIPRVPPGSIDPSRFKSPELQRWSFPQYSQTWAFTPPQLNNQPPSRPKRSTGKM